MEYLVEKISLFEIMKLAEISFQEHVTKTTTTSVFLKPEGSKIKITFMAVNYNESLKNFKETFKLIDKNICRFKKKFVMDFPLNGRECFYQIFVNETTHARLKKSYVFINDKGQMQFKMKYLNKNIY